VELERQLPHFQRSTGVGNRAHIVIFNRNKNVVDVLKEWRTEGD